MRAACAILLCSLVTGTAQVFLGWPGTAFAAAGIIGGACVVWATQDDIRAREARDGR